MEMENINENTIRVLIENSDLEERGITFLDLLGNQKQIENFFYSILEEVDVDNQFHETDAITFQVLPSGSGLELFISKGHNDDFEALDGEDDPLNQVVDYMKKQTEEHQHEKTVDLVEKVIENDLSSLEVMLQFEDFEDFVEVSKRFYLESGLSTLYHYKEKYYLSIVFFLDEMTDTDLDKEIAIALEYAEESDIATEILGEYGKIIMKGNALETARHYFK